jgi:hypothetical protein
MSKYFIKGTVFCKVCNLTYTKSGSHASCYKKFCSICSYIFDTPSMQIKHSLDEHPEYFCSKCNECVANIKAHKINYCKT